jgi:hypothetical protein
MVPPGKETAVATPAVRSSPRCRPRNRCHRLQVFAAVDRPVQWAPAVHLVAWQAWYNASRELLPLSTKTAYTNHQTAVCNAAVVVAAAPELLDRAREPWIMQMDYMGLRLALAKDWRARHTVLMASVSFRQRRLVRWLPPLHLGAQSARSRQTIRHRFQRRLLTVSCIRATSPSSASKCRPRRVLCCVSPLLGKHTSQSSVTSCAFTPPMQRPRLWCLVLSTRY